MKQVFIQKGKAVIGEVPAPLAGDDEILVQVHYSCISIGTEMFKVEASGRPLYKKILDKPQNISRVLERLREHGVRDAIIKVKSKIEGKNPIGYSASGIVLETGKNIKNFKPGDRVACAGDKIANHAEFIAVSENLTVKVPPELSLKEASTVALGSIAMQGVRRCSPSLGETIAVIGLGNIGQLTCQMLKAAGCRVIGIDIDRSRVDTAVSMGTDLGLNPHEADQVSEVIKYTEGYGADAVIITASSASESIINQSMEMCRKKGRIVIVGNVKLNIDREKFYEKELDVLISTSYGPGRYDLRYELQSCDYPYPYVRWTENRNMKEYIRLISEKKVNISSLIEKTFSIEQVSEAYNLLKSSEKLPLMVVLEYSSESKPSSSVKLHDFAPKKDRINVAIIGTGSFVKDMHLPNLSQLEDLYKIYAVCDKVGSNAMEIAEQYNTAYGTTDYKKVLEDSNIDMVVIATRHNLHAQMAAEALEAGKAVFIEKPLALNEGELGKIIKIMENKELPLTVDFNRRFSPLARKIKKETEGRVSPLLINYRMNAGYIPAESWVHSEEGGGRNIGEACHIYDLFNYFTESEAISIKAEGISPKTDGIFSNDNFTALIKYGDGSVCNLIYSSMGSQKVPKEQMEIYFDGKIIYLNDYIEMKIFDVNGRDLILKKQDKGHLSALKEFSYCLNNFKTPIPFWQLVQASEISFEVEKQIKGKIPENKQV